jgi:hypothetical protein
MGAGLPSGPLLDRLGFPRELAKVLTSAEQGIGLNTSVLGLLRKLEESLRGAGSDATAGGAAAAPGVPAGTMDKVLYLSVLRGAIQKAAESQHFNLETQINDLWVRLSQVKQTKGNGETAKLQALIARRPEMFNVLRQIIGMYDATARSIIQSVGR